MKEHYATMAFFALACIGFVYAVWVLTVAIGGLQ
jgi:hypothetical protein